MSELFPCPLDPETRCLRVKCCVGCQVFEEFVTEAENILKEIDSLSALITRQAS